MLGRARSGSLRRRLAFALAGLSISALIGLACVYAFSEHAIEEAALRREMTEELRELMAREERGETAPWLASSLSYYSAGQVPSELASIPPGQFRRLRFHTRSVEALAATDPRGAVHVLVQDITSMQERESSLVVALFAGVLIAALGAWLVSGVLARQILSPLTALVQQIRRVNPLKPAPPGFVRTGDEELDAIPHAIDALIGELDHVLERERAFANAASHELRTPLAIVRGAVDVLKERGDSPAAVVERLDRAARRAEEDLHALLALSPLREPAPPRQTDLREFLPAASEPYLRQGVKAQVVWEWPSSSEARVEPASLGIIFTNLLRNALRAAPEGRIVIRSDASRVEIVDDGEGLPEGWPANGSPHGRGLGLSIARILAERNGWQLRVEPASPRGTRASVVFGGAPGGPGA